MMSMLPTLALAVLMAAAVFQVVYMFRKDGREDPASPWLLGAATVLVAAVMAERSFRIGFVALTSTYESLMFYAAIVAALGAGYRAQNRVTRSRGIAFGATFGAIVLMAIASSPLIPKDALPPIPALRSGWLILHVSFSFIGESFFIVSFVASIAFLATRDPGRRLDFDRITYTAISVGYPIFTAGALIFGAIWAEQAWGRWWSWDPKETWGLITWLVYTVYLHLRLIMKKKDATASWISVAGFLCTVFTFFGVNYLLPGLHSYG